VIPAEAVEIGYLCHKGHFIFHDDPDVDYACGSKRIAALLIQPDEGVTEGMYAEAVDDAREEFRSALERAYQ
jgi:hypothetical protein